MDRIGQEHFRKLERMYLSAPINRFFAPVIRVSEGATEITMPVKEDLFHAASAIHGAVYFKALDDASFFAAASLVQDVFVLTVTFSIHIVRPVSTGEIKSVGKVVHQSKNLLIADALAHDSEGRQVARGTGTFMRSKIALTPEIGYR